MIRKYHNHKLQVNPWHREEEPHNNHEAPGRPTKQSGSLFPIKMIAKLERIQSNAQQNHRTTTDSHNGSNNKQQQQNRRLRTDSSPSHQGAKTHLLGTKSPP